MFSQKLSLSNLTFFQDLSEIKKRLAAIENWQQGQAIPTMDINKTNISTTLTKALENKDVITAIISDIKNQLRPTIESAMLRINDAKAYAEGALQSAQEIVATIDRSAKGLQADGDRVKIMTDDMLASLGRETNNIKTAFQDFGTTMQGAATKIVIEAQDVAAELVEAHREIKPTLDNAIVWANRIRSRARRWDWLGALEAAFVTVARLLFSGVSAESGPVIPEFLEAFDEISSAFTALANSFVSFGKASKDAPLELGADINNSVNAITAGITNFGNSFGTLTDGLAARFEGLPPPAPAEIIRPIYVKTPTELEAERIRQQQIAAEKARIEYQQARALQLQQDRQLQMLQMEQQQAPAPTTTTTTTTRQLTEEEEIMMMKRLAGR